MSEIGDRPTALVVDDEFLIAVELERALQAAGYVVLTAVTLREARAQLDQRHIDIAVLDFRMGTDTVELAHALREKAVPFIFCTGSLRDEVQAAFPGATMIGKPFSEAELLTAIASAKP